MAVFTYTALSPDGRTTTGTLPAESRTAAISAVVGKGLHPVQVLEQGQKAVRPALPTTAQAGAVKQTHVESFTRELANLLGGGVPLSRALHLLRREASAPGPRQLWGQIHDDVVGGTGLADALAQHPKTFSPIYIAMVRAGEAGGFLEVVLSQIADFRTRERDLRGRVLAAMIYPMVLIVLAIGVLTFLMTFFIPRFTPFFKEFGGALPWLTQAIIGLSSLATRYGLFVLVAVVVGAVMLRRAALTESGRRRIERAILATPALGRVVSHFALVRFCRMLGTLLGAGVSLVAALRTAKEAIGNQTLADAVAHGIEQVQRGESLARALGEAERLFPPSVIEMIAIAEETSRLDKELVRLSLSYEAELDRRLRMLVALVEPVMLFVMAAVIGTVVIGMLLPIFNLQELVK